MTRSPMRSEVPAEVVNRLRSAEGHLRAVIRMVEADEPCEHVLHQLGAVEAALRAAGGIMLECQAQRCAEIIVHNPCADERIAELQRLARLYPLAFHPKDIPEVNP